MKELETYMKEFEQHLKQYSIHLISDFEFLISRESKNENLDYFHFERDFDDYNAVFISYDKDGNVITDCLVLPIKDRTKNLYDFDNRIDLYFKSNLSIEEDLFEDEYDISEEYYEQKNAIFENWFCDCWQKATELTSIHVNAYLFMHESYSIGLNLHTQENERVEEEIKFDDFDGYTMDDKPWWKFW